MLKKYGALLLMAVVLISSLGITAIANEEKVEIVFCVGDATLMINGEAVTVEKPYVVGEGVTLVPVRVITEAFGAKVDWIAETKTVTLDYPDVNIVLQIENPVAEINGRAEKLLSAPELTANGFTMVPLRFISENFGATVTYDESTKKITVTKGASSESGTIVEGANDSKYVGDSYYGWTMENPVDMQMDTRDFDGRYTSWMYDDNNWIAVSVYDMKEDYNFEDEFAYWKESFQELTLTKADKNVSNPSEKIMHFCAKDKTDYYEVYEIATEKYNYIVYGTFENEKADIKNEGIRILSTFDLKYTGDETYDLSNVKNGMRRFEADTMKLSFDVPQDYLVFSDEDSENSFYFGRNNVEDDVSSIIVEIYSKDSVKSAKDLAQSDFDRNKKYCNEEIVKFDESITEKSYKNITVQEYTYEIHATSYSEYNTDVFFELGEYVYNFHLIVKLPNEKKQEIVNNILNSIEAQEVDFSQVGTILRNVDEPEGTFTADGLNGCELEIPNEFDELSETKTAAAYVGNTTMLQITVNIDDEYNNSKIKELAESVESYQKKFEGVEIIESVKSVTVGKNKFLKISYKVVEDDVVGYVENYFAANNGKAYVIEAIYTELGYSQYARNQVQEILKSVQYK